MKPTGSAVSRAATWAGWPLRSEQERILEDFRRWLQSEAIPGGALGPNEGPRLESRHLADSLLFAVAWDRRPPPRRLADLGSGAGLPGIPLAILWPDTAVHLVERRGRRADLLRRAARVLGLGNVTVEPTDAARLPLSVDMVVARAAGPPALVQDWARSLLEPGGVVAVGGSWRERPDPGPDERVVEVPAKVLDRPVWLRIMAAP